MGDLDSAVAQLIGAAIDGNEPDAANLVERLVGGHGATSVLSSIRRLCVDAERLPSAEHLVAWKVHTGDGHRSSLGDAVERVLFSDSLEDVDQVMSPVAPLLSAASLVHATLEKCVELSAILTWSRADLVATDAPHFSTMRGIILRGAASTTELLRLADHLDSQGEDIAARAVGSAAKARSVIDVETSATRQESD